MVRYKIKQVQNGMKRKDLCNELFIYTKLTQHVSYTMGKNLGNRIFYFLNECLFHGDQSIRDALQQQTKC